MGILGFILMVVIGLLGLRASVDIESYIDVGSVIITVVVTLAALAMSYGAAAFAAIRTVFTCAASARNTVPPGLAKRSTRTPGPANPLARCRL